MDFEQLQSSHGWRPVFNYPPATRDMSQKVVIPFGVFYSPFLAYPQQLIKGKFPNCPKCSATVNLYARKNKNNGSWICNFCATENPYSQNLGMEQIEEVYEGKAGDCGIFFIIDTCISKEQMQAVKTSLLTIVKQFPENIYIGLIYFNRNVMMADFSGDQVEYLCFNGTADYKSSKQISQSFGFNEAASKNISNSLLSKNIYVPYFKNSEKLIQAIENLENDTYQFPRQQRQKRATGAALQFAINSICSIGINTRFVTLIGGPCTIGPGKVVDLPLKETIRVYMDIFSNNQNTKHIDSATKVYERLAKTMIENRCTMDIWAFGLDQFGILEMRELVNQTGGMLAMQQQFSHQVFMESFPKFYMKNENQQFDFPFAGKLRLVVSKQLKINGILGTCKSLKQNNYKYAAEMQIGEGQTNQWYIGGIAQNNSLCIMLTYSDLAASENKEKGCFIQALTTYKYSDNILRTKVSTIFLEYRTKLQIRDILLGFDEQAAAVMLARMASRKSEVEDIMQVKKWIDRILIRFTAKFSQYTRSLPETFQLPLQMKHFPQFMYHLRRSGLVNPFGCPPDQSIYTKTCLLRQSLPNCMSMIQAVLLKYSPQSVNQDGIVEPQPVELDYNQLKDDAVLLLDSYFTVIVWFGESIQSWRQDKLDEDPEYQYLKQLFEAPFRDAKEIINDRMPISVFHQTYYNHSKSRYLKARVNPSHVKGQEGDGHFVSDDASIETFMNFLVKSVVDFKE